MTLAWIQNNCHASNHTVSNLTCQPFAWRVTEQASPERRHTIYHGRQE